MPSFEQTIIDLINSQNRYLMLKPLLLGGITDSGGGTGGPPGGFVGHLPQTKVAYDLSELATMDVPESGASLIDNLNHIRSRLGTIESADNGHTIQDEGISLPQRDILNFVGAGVTVTDDSGVTVVEISTTTVSGGGGSVGFQELVDATDISWDLSGGSAKVTLSGDRTLSNPTNLGAGAHYFLSVIQDAIGNRLLGYGSDYKFPSFVKPALSTFHDFEDVLTFECDGTYMINTGIIKNVRNTAPNLSYTTNLLTWLLADEDTYSDNGVTPCTTLDTVYSWFNHGTSSDAVQATSANRPQFVDNVLNGKPVIRFDGAATHMAITGMDAGDNVSFFIVMIPHNTTPIGIFDSVDDSSTPPVRNYPAGAWNDFGPQTTMGLPDTNPILFELVMHQSSGRSNDYYRNATFIGNVNNIDETPNAWNNPHIGCINLGDAGWFDGDIAEILVYSEALTDPNREIVENYLMSKYGI